MDGILRRFVEWKARRKGAQIIIFDGGTEVEKTRSFVKGTLVGVGIAVLALSLTGPTVMDPVLASEIERRGTLLRESSERAEQAMRVADVCLSTAQNLERTVAAYQALLGSSGMARAGALVAPVPRAD